MNPTSRRRVLHSLLHRLRRHALLLPLACALTSKAQDADLDALQLADTAPALAGSAPAAPRSCKAYAEISYGQNRTRNDGPTHQQRRLPLVAVHDRARLLLTELAQRGEEGPVVSPRPSQQMIADHVGASRSMINRVVKELTAEGWLDVRDDALVIPTRETRAARGGATAYGALSAMSE